MKTSYKIISAAMLALLVSFGASAQSGLSQSFINGYNLQVSATSTNSYGVTNTYATGFVQTNSATYPYVSGYQPLYLTNANAIADVPLWANRDGTVPLANISIQIVGTNAAFTNIGTFTFTAVPVIIHGGGSIPPGLLTASTSAQNQFTVAVTGNGTNAVCVATNLPTSVIQGSRGLRLSSIAWSNAGTNGTVTGVFLNGFKPD